MREHLTISFMCYINLIYFKVVKIYYLQNNAIYETLIISTLFTGLFNNKRLFEQVFT